MDQPERTITITQRHLSAAAKGVTLADIKSAQSELEAACNRKIEAAEDFTILCKAVAEKSRVDASVISVYITAICKDTLKKQQEKSEQLVLLFEEL